MGYNLFKTLVYYKYGYPKWVASSCLDATFTCWRLFCR